MKTPFFFYLFLFCSFASFSQTENPLIPIPSSVIKQPGFFSLHNNLVISINSDEKSSVFVADQLSKQLAAPTGLKIAVNKNTDAANIQLRLLKTKDTKEKIVGSKKQLKNPAQ